MVALPFTWKPLKPKKRREKARKRPPRRPRKLERNAASLFDSIR